MNVVQPHLHTHSTPSTLILDQKHLGSYTNASIACEHDMFMRTTRRGREAALNFQALFFFNFVYSIINGIFSKRNSIKGQKIWKTIQMQHGNNTPEE